MAMPGCPFPHLARFILAQLAVTSLIGAQTPAGASDSRGPVFRERWVYCSTNLLVDQNVDQVISLIERAAKSGYTGLMLADYKFQILDRMGETGYFRNAERVKAAAARAKLEIIPAVFSIGYSNGILAHDPNLAEGILASAVPHRVRQGRLVLEPLPDARIRNGDFEQAERDRFPGFTFQDDPGRSTHADSAVVHSGKGSCRIEAGRNKDGGGNVRVMEHVRVRSHACYRLSCWVKTKELSVPGSFHLLALGGKSPGRSLTFQEGGVEPTQDWKPLDVVFNTLDQSEVNLYCGIWGDGSGTVWIDDLRLDELSLVNVLRRKGCPLAVTSADGKTSYVEGRDFEPVADAKLGQVPYAGEFEYEHDGPQVRLTSRSRIKEGQRLLVSWYHPILTHGSQIMCCLSDPKVETILRDQARRVTTLFHPRTFFMSHDEIRMANWCRACLDRKLTPGKLLAENVRQCAAILKQVNPRARLVVWSDMFDPNHNAVDQYYLVNGSLKGSWDGLAREVVIANWNSGKARESLRWFAARGHRQIIAGYYDADDLSELQRWKTAAAGVEGVFGFMYTTWQAKFGLLERYGEELRKRD
jgi:hypothetical protein